MSARLATSTRTIIIATCLGTAILGLGGRAAMHVIARITTGSGAFSFGGTLTVVFLGAVSGLAGGLILVTARALFRRWPPTTTIVYWTFLIGTTLRGLRPIDDLRLALFLPLVFVFGATLQWWTFGRHGGNRPGSAAPT
jgi:hypothetical protein